MILWYLWYIVLWYYGTYDITNQCYDIIDLWYLQAYDIIDLRYHRNYDIIDSFRVIWYLLWWHRIPRFQIILFDAAFCHFVNLGLTTHSTFPIQLDWYCKWGVGWVGVGWWWGEINWKIESRHLHKISIFQNSF